MSRDTVFSPGSAGKPGLLDELDDIRSLLGDALDDGAQGLPDDLDIPLLEPESPPAAATRPRATAAAPTVSRPTSKTPPVPPSSSTSGSKPVASGPLEDLLSARENPFLPRHTMERLAQHRAHTPEGLRPPAPATAADKATLTGSAATPARPSDASIRAAVDEILAVWMPRIERELRDRLTQQLRDGDDA
ncbi:MAG: hypothetical protein LAT61_15480 [Alcanivorax sp.]|nr:hypothetical protein [Alcanivorax sp.]